MFERPRPADFRQGSSLSSVVKHVTQREINLYAEASGDFNPIHIDEAFASATPLGGTIAHGMLILAYASEMMTRAFGRNWLEGGRLSVRFKAAARPEDTITTSGRVDSIEDREGIPHAHCSLECCNQKDEVIITGEAVVKLQ
ncbi:MAG: MaoC family dehydratase [Dehalococcoidales bacterium]|nr:MaoC family dehydratase [Dehalococcoidales bacterium]